MDGGLAVSAMKESNASRLKFRVDLFEREGYWAARTTPFAITAYGSSRSGAERRAVEAFNLRVKRHGAGFLEHLQESSSRNASIESLASSRPRPKRTVTRQVVVPIE